MHLKQRWFILIVLFLFIISLPVRLLADGTYYVGRDDGGVYFQTDQDGGWYIDKEDLRYFKIDQKGTYSIKMDFVEAGINEKLNFMQTLLIILAPSIP